MNNIKLVKFLSVFLLSLHLFSSCSLSANKNGELDTQEIRVEGANVEHLFEFDECAAFYNQKPFMIGDSISYMVEIFGLYDRVVDKNIYIWDSLGIVMTASWLNEPDNTQVNNFYLYWNSELTDNDFNDRLSQQVNAKKRIMERLPKSYFQGKVTMGGALLGRDMDINSFVSETSIPFTNERSRTLYYHTMPDCYIEGISSIYMPEYCIRISEDGSNIEGLMLSRLYIGL